MKRIIYILFICILLLSTKCRDNDPVVPAVNVDTVLVDIVEGDTNQEVIFKVNLAIALKYGMKVKVIDTSRGTTFSIFFADVKDNRCLIRPQCLDSSIAENKYLATFYLEYNNQIIDTISLYNNYVRITINNFEYGFMLIDLYPVPDQSNPFPSKEEYIASLSLNRF